MENKTETILIDKKVPYSGNALTPPQGDFYSNNSKYTCWNETIFATFKVGDFVEVSYTEKSNDYNGKVYINKNISKMIYAPSGGKPPESIRDYVKQSQSIESSSSIDTEPNQVAGKIRINNNLYEVILRKINE